MPAVRIMPTRNPLNHGGGKLNSVVPLFPVEQVSLHSGLQGFDERVIDIEGNFLEWCRV